MVNVSKISTNLIVVSLVSLLMVFWLGSRYISDAHTQFSGAMQLKRSVAPETTLFEVANSLDLERASIQRVLASSVDIYDAELDKLHENSQNTVRLFNRARDEINDSRTKISDNTQRIYSNDSIEAQLTDLDDKLKRISITNTLIVAQIYLPHSERDESIRMQLFDAYSNLIIDVNTLRKRTRTLPEVNYKQVLSNQDAKNSIWIARESIHQTNSLLESFLLKKELTALDNLNRENLSLRLFQQTELTKQSISDLRDMVQGDVITGDLAKAIADLDSIYNNTYQSYTKKLSMTVASYTEASATLADSIAIADSVNKNIQQLSEAALSNTRERATSIENDAATTLLLNTFMVFLCLLVALGSFRVSRKIQHQANHDDLTGIANRRKFSNTLQSLFHKTDVSKQEKLVLMTLDLNGFKAINDTMGHHIGDKLLISVVRRLKIILKEHMMFARMGGDEFAIAYTGKDSDETYKFACELRDAFVRPFAVDDSIVKIDTSVGYSTYPNDAKTVEQLQITSDFAMFSAKQTSDKKVQPYDREIAEKFENRVAIEKDLTSAIEKNELELHYQPQFNLTLNKVNAVEALIRWNHPTRGMVPPFEFIEIAEDAGLMPPIGNWVLNEACRQAAIWNNKEGLAIRVAVNVSVHQVMQPEFVDGVIDTMKRHNISPDHLELEITESVMIADTDWIVSSLNKLKATGIKIALDDFGTGYSSLSQLQALPLDTLKIDRSFISKIDDAGGNMKSVTATIASIAEIYGLETVAEGIESNEQLTAVNKLGIDVAQGYYYSKPLPRDQVAATIMDINAKAREGDNDLNTTFKKAA